MSQLVIHEPRVKRRVEAGDETISIMLRLRAGAKKSAATRIRGKEGSDFNPHVWSGEKSSESFTAFKNGTAEFGRSAARQGLGGCGIERRKTNKARSLELQRLGQQARAQRSLHAPPERWKTMFATGRNETVFASMARWEGQSKRLVVLGRRCQALKEEVEHSSERQEVLTVLMESKINMQRTAPERHREQVF